MTNQHASTDASTDVFPNVFQRVRPWLFFLAFAAILFVGYTATNLEASPAQSTVPPIALKTRLTGPIDSTSPTEWVVAGITVHITADTRIDERARQSTIPGGWARVIGQGDGQGGLIAARIKILPPKHFVGLRGPLDELTDTAVVVDGISVARTVTTKILGDPQPGQDRVDIRAAIQIDGSLLALRVKKVGPPDDFDDGQRDRTELKGVVQEMTDGPGVWTISGVPVTVTDTTQIKHRVGPIMVGSWVEVEGRGDGQGGLTAREIKSIPMQRHHKLQGPLTELTDTTVVVDGIPVDLSPDVRIKGDPQPGQKVEVKAILQPDGSMLAFEVKQEGRDDDDRPGHEVKFGGIIESMPATGFDGVWVISGREVNVVEGLTEIDEHKGPAEVGARVEVEAIREADGALTALEIEVKKDGDTDENDHGRRYVEFKGTVESLPAGGLIGAWVVDGRTVEVSQHTRIKQENGPIVVGSRVEVEGWKLEDGTIQARKIESKDGNNDDEDHGAKVEFTGHIVSFPQDLIGEWTIDDETVIATEATLFKQKDGPFEVGALVQVKGVRQNDGAVLAFTIKTESGE